MARKKSSSSCGEKAELGRKHGFSGDFKGIVQIEEKECDMIWIIWMKRGRVAEMCKTENTE